MDLMLQIVVIAFMLGMLALYIASVAWAIGDVQKSRSPVQR
jgi:hypothetical protein